MPFLNNLQDLRTILGRLNAERPAGPGNKEGETRHQERGGNLLQRLNLELESRKGKARVLVTGQIGVGKSSELLHFLQNRGEEHLRAGYWIYCDLEKEEHPERCGATGVFLTIFRDCWQQTRYIQNKLDLSHRNKMDFLRLRDEIVEKLIDWLKGQRSENGQKATFRFGGMDFPVFLQEERKESALALILGKAAQHEAVSLGSERYGLAPDSLINLLNKLLNWFAIICKGQIPTLIVDHVDKIRDQSAAREVLLEVVPQWRRINASVIMTAPYEYTLGEMRHSIESNWGKPLMIYPLRIPDLNNTFISPIYEEIVKSCGLAKLIPPESLRLLAHYSGGIPRTFIQFLIDACKEAHLAGHKRIEVADAQAIIYNAQRAYQDYGPTELELLDQIDQSKIGLGSAATLLRSPIGLLVMEAEKGEQPIRIHPLAEKILERYRINKGEKVG
ncbi:MAG: hypothetical protein C4527_03705 [Candidatus Omnitrophota bacterium]|jgi:hypothetical protein|nr:MAG: hypothetical protein C4527_03705 [Candidatus Omnitrophota bacterium]